ncbi:MAG TPA: hypothetical protein VFN35_34495, partial [Ktedonobacteraceae bacterium]|nr:hypothetical protein [Ktedonobacteraceae bacterium]
YDLGRQGLQLACSTNVRLQMAKALIPLAGALGMQSQSELAARLLGASEKALERLGALNPPSDQMELDAIIAAVHAQLDDATFQSIWDQGRELTLEQAVALALDE